MHGAVAASESAEDTHDGDKDQPPDRDDDDDDDDNDNDGNSGDASGLPTNSLDVAPANVALNVPVALPKPVFFQEQL